MSEIEPQEARGGLAGVAQEVMVVGPHGGDEEIADCVADPCGPELHERLEGRLLRRTQLQDQHGYEDGEHAVGERAHSLGSRFAGARGAISYIEAESSRVARRYAGEEEA